MVMVMVHYTTGVGSTKAQVWERPLGVGRSRARVSRKEVNEWS